MGRLRALDGLRGLLALYILAGHTLPFIALPTGLAPLTLLVSHGRAAVDLFFILSGLVILRALEGLAGGGLAAPRFLAARAGRLLPVYGLALLLACLAIGLGNPMPSMAWLPHGGAAREIVGGGWPSAWPWHLIAHLVLLQGLLPPAILPDAEFSVLGPAWSLSTEWQFYALAALVLASLRSAGITGRLVRCCTLALFLLGGLGLANGLLPPAWHFSRAFLPLEAWYFALGLASHQLLRHPGCRRERWFFALAFAVACGLSALAARAPAMLVPLAWALCLGCERPDLGPGRARPLLRLGQRILTAPALLWAGRISYSLYLTHAPLQRLLMVWLAPLAQGNWQRFTLLWTGPAIVLPVLAAALVYTLVEEPLRRWSRARVAGVTRPANPPLAFGSGSNTSAAGRP